MCCSAGLPATKDRVDYESGYLGAAALMISICSCAELCMIVIHPYAMLCSARSCNHEIKVASYKEDVIIALTVFRPCFCRALCGRSCCRRASCDRRLGVADFD